MSLFFPLPSLFLVPSSPLLSAVNLHLLLVKMRISSMKDTADGDGEVRDPGGFEKRILLRELSSLTDVSRVDERPSHQVDLLLVLPILYNPAAMSLRNRDTDIQMPTKSKTSSLPLSKANRPIPSKIKETTRRSPPQTNRSNSTTRSSTPLNRPSERRYRNNGSIHHFHFYPHDYPGESIT